MAAILGPVLGTEAVVVAPRAQAAKMPIIFSQSASTGTLVGNYTFRITPPPISYNKQLFDYLSSHSVKSFNILYASDSAGTVDYAKNVWPTLAKGAGLTIGQSIAVPTSTQDYSAPVAHLISDKPDAVGLNVLGAGFVTAVKQLRLNDYKGVIFATSVIDSFMEQMGADGKGVVWPNTWTPLSTSAASKRFVSDFKAKFNGDTPKNFAADGYDSTWWLARALKQANSATRENIQKGLAQVAKTGFEGVQGKYTFEDNDARLPGVLLTWNGNQRSLVN
jgi:branched-chain amino acid transport system substrate-binding protein